MGANSKEPSKTKITIREKKLKLPTAGIIQVYLTSVEKKLETPLEAGSLIGPAVFNLGAREDAHKLITRDL